VVSAMPAQADSTNIARQQVTAIHSDLPVPWIAALRSQ